VIARVWRTGLDETRAEEYDRFAAQRSTPMFRRQPGLLGVLFTRTERGRAVITLWRDARDVEALERSEDYRATVAAIGAAGFLRGPQEVEVLPVDAAWIGAVEQLG
jgi:heme-degrading monooxygenase HmoA